jgi:hypothetical protein
MPGTVAVAPYITADDLLAYMDLPRGKDDAGAAAAAAAACDAVSQFCNAGQAGIRLQQVTEQLTGGGGPTLFPRRRNIASADACVVTYPAWGTSSVSVPVAVWEDTISRTDGAYFPSGARVLLTYTAGLNPLPDDFVFATLRTAQGIYLAQVRDPNVVNEQIGRAFTGQVRQEGAGSIPPEAQRMLFQHRWVNPF